MNELSCSYLPFTYTDVPMTIAHIHYRCIAKCHNVSDESGANCWILLSDLNEWPSSPSTMSNTEPPSPQKISVKV